jgi:hypothetical protein
VVFLGETEKGVEEYYRRMIVKLIREAGTAIRKEMVKRHALTAEINLRYAESAKKLIEEDYKLLFKPLEDIFNESIGKVTKGEDLGKVIAETLSNLLAIGIGVQLVRPPSIIVEHINSVNSFLKSVVNKIIEELSKEGIYLPPIEPISLPASPDIASLANGLRETLSRIDMAIGILRGLIDASKEDC